MIAPKIEVRNVAYIIIAPQLNNFPLLQAMSKDFANVVFLKVDVDECEDIASEHNISCMPTFLYLKNGVKVSLQFQAFLTIYQVNNLVQVAEFSGANEGQLRELVEKHKN